MRPLLSRLKSVGLGLLLAVTVLLLAQLADSVRDEAARLASGTHIRWSVLVRLALGGLLGYGVLTGRRDWLIPGTAALVLAVPLLAGPGLRLLRPLAELLPASGALPSAVAVGVLVAGAIFGGRSR